MYKYVVIVFFKIPLDSGLFFDRFRYCVEDKIFYSFNKKLATKKMIKYLKKDFDIKEENIFSIKIYLLK